MPQHSRARQWLLRFLDGYCWLTDAEIGRAREQAGLTYREIMTEVGEGLREGWLRTWTSTGIGYWRLTRDEERAPQP